MKLSAALITRNEAPRIARCLRAIRDHVDEVVLLDTGSDDDTMAIAKRAGADVILSEPERTVDLGDGFRCLGDFAAARNRVLNAASGDWLLVVDADHVYCPPTFVAIREAMKDETVHAAALRFHIAKSQKARPADVVTGSARLGQAFNSVAMFRVHPTDKHYYDGIIHEVASQWLDRRHHEAGTRQVVLADSRIADYGHESGIRKELSKDERNRRLLELAIKTNPDDPAPFTYLAGIYLQLHDFKRTSDLIADVYDKIGKDKRLTGAHLLRLCVTMGLLGFNIGRPDMVWEAANIWERHDHRKHPDILCVRGLACEMLGRPDDAIKYYKAAQSTSVDAVGSQHLISDVPGDRLRELQASARSLIVAP